MNKVEEDFVSLLKSHRSSLTSQRLLVFNLLVGKEPQSLHELADKAKGKVDRASIYRIIDLFEKIGVTQRINTGWKYKIELSDKFSEHHHHLSCNKCHRVIPINEETLETFIKQVSSQYRFESQDHQVEIQGLCSNCVAA